MQVSSGLCQRWQLTTSLAERGPRITTASMRREAGAAGGGAGLRRWSCNQAIDSLSSAEREGWAC